MLTLSFCEFSNIGWPLEESTSHNENYFYGGTTTEALEQFHYQLSSSRAQVEIETSTPSAAISRDLSMVKKFNHNASERDRRKKINALYSSLRALLPVAEQMKKLSNPTIISRVLKYIPELQHQVERLSKKKEEILLSISRQEDVVITKENRRKIAHHNSGFVVSTSRLSENEAAIQISSQKAHKIPLSEILLCLENDGLVLLNGSSSETFGGRVFYNLHFQMDKLQRLESEIITEKLLSVIGNKEGNFLVN